MRLLRRGDITPAIEYAKTHLAALNTTANFLLFPFQFHHFDQALIKDGFKEFSDYECYLKKTEQLYKLAETLLEENEFENAIKLAYGICGTMMVVDFLESFCKTWSLQSLPSLNANQESKQQIFSFIKRLPNSMQQLIIDFLSDATLRSIDQPESLEFRKIVSEIVNHIDPQALLKEAKSQFVCVMTKEKRNSFVCNLLKMENFTESTAYTVMLFARKFFKEELRSIIKIYMARDKKSQPFIDTASHCSEFADIREELKEIDSSQDLSVMISRIQKLPIYMQTEILQITHQTALIQSIEKNVAAQKEAVSKAEEDYRNLIAIPPNGQYDDLFISEWLYREYPDLSLRNENRSDFQKKGIELVPIDE